MTSNGKAQVSAPKCTTVSISMNSGSTAGTGSQTVFSTGDAELTTAIAAAHTTNLVVSQRNGFIAGTMILAPGTSKEEEVTASGLTTEVGAGTLAVTVTATKYAHAIGTRVVMKNSPIRPGSLTVSINSATAVALDPTASGTLSGTPSGAVSATANTVPVDYALGAVNFTVATNVTNGHTVVIKADTFADTPNDIASGKNFFKNFGRMSNGRADLPTGAVISNLGSAEVGVLVEKANAEDASQFIGATDGAVLKGFGSKVVTFPSGMPSELRIRAGVSSTGSLTPSTATERNNDPGVIDVAYFSVINANGGSN
jgi:hypothetical protein